MKERGTISEQDFLKGQLLIAMPNLKQGCFKESVVLVCSHDDEHAMGVIINRQISDLTFAELLEQVDIEPEPSLDTRPVHFGGPVDTKRGIVLHTTDYTIEETVQIMPGIGLTASKSILAALNEGDSMVHQDARGPANAILCMGHAGWAAGQLEHELAQNAWINAPASQELIFQKKTSTIWQDALARLGVSRSMFSPEWSDIRDPDAPLN